MYKSKSSERNRICGEALVQHAVQKQFFVPKNEENKQKHAKGTSCKHIQVLNTNEFRA